MRAIILAVVTGLVAGCSGEPATTGAVDVEPERSGLKLTNRTDAPIHHFAVEAERAAAILWAPCTDPARCPPVAPGRRITIPAADITAYESASTEAIVYWWHLVPTPGGTLQPDSVRSTRVRLR